MGFLTHVIIVEYSREIGIGMPTARMLQTFRHTRCVRMPARPFAFTTRHLVIVANSRKPVGEEVRKISNAHRYCKIQLFSFCNTVLATGNQSFSGHVVCTDRGNQTSGVTIRLPREDLNSRPSQHGRHNYILSSKCEWQYNSKCYCKAIRVC